MSESIVFDESRFPVVVMRLPPALTAASVLSLGEGFNRVFARRSKFAIVADLRTVKHAPDALTRRKLTDQLSDSALRTRQELYQVGSANIVESAPIRAALTAVLWVWSAPVPMYAAASLEDAETWCRARLKEHGVVVPGFAAHG